MRIVDGRRRDIFVCAYGYVSLCYQRWHPDKNTDKREEATAMFQRIGEAYQGLAFASYRSFPISSSSSHAFTVCVCFIVVLMSVLSDPEKRSRYDAGDDLDDDDGGVPMDVSELFAAMMGGFAMPGMGGGGGGFSFMFPPHMMFPGAVYYDMDDDDMNELDGSDDDDGDGEGDGMSTDTEENEYV